MHRVFQHYEGVVDELKGASFSSVKSLYDKLEHDIVLVWARDETLNCWYRVFIDGVYCGVDRYQLDESSNDIDDEVDFVDHSAWFQGKKLEHAEVTSPNKSEGHIVLTMTFGSHQCRLICGSEDGECQLQFTDSAIS
jgi:hypothetical protein